MSYQKEYSIDSLFPENNPQQTYEMTPLTLMEFSVDSTYTQLIVADSGYTESSYTITAQTAITEADFKTIFSATYKIIQHQTYSLNNYTYTIGDSSMSITLPDLYSTDSNCNQNIEYTIAQTNGSALPDFIAFDSTTRSFSVETNNYDYASNYTLKVQFYSTDAPTVIDDMLEFTIDVEGTQVVNNFTVDEPTSETEFISPPVFQTDLGFLTLKQGDTMTYKLPTVVSSTGNSVNMEISMDDAQKGFVNYQNSEFFIHPSTTTEPNVYSIPIKLVDSVTSTLTTSYTLSI